MIGTDFFNLLMGRLGDRSEPALRSICLLEAKLVQETELEGGTFLPWFLINRSLTGQFTLATRELAVPTGFIKELEEEDAIVVTGVDGEEYELIKKPYNELRNWWGLDAVADEPTNYSLSGDKFLIFPLPNLALNVRFRCYVKDALLNDNGVETLWLKWASDLLLAYTGYNVATKHLTWPEKAAEFSSDKSTAMGRLITADIARAEASMDRNMG